MSERFSNPDRPRIAVAGATGRVGARLIANLASDPVDVVALTRNPKTERLAAGVARAAVDFDAPSTLLEALRGVDRLFLAHGTSDRQVTNEIALIDAAVASGVTHIVKLSAMGPPTRLMPFAWHMEIEAHLAQQDTGYTVLRPGPFVDSLAGAAGSVSAATWGGAAGDGQVNLIDTRDVADVARVTLVDDRFLASQRAYHLTGPSRLTMSEVAEALSLELGHNVHYGRRSPAEHRDILIRSGVTEMAADLRLGLDRLFAESVLAETTTTVFDLIGKQPRSVASWLSDNVSLFSAPVDRAPSAMTEDSKSQ